MTKKGIVTSPKRGFKINIDSVEGTYTTSSSELEEVEVTDDEDLDRGNGNYGPHWRDADEDDVHIIHKPPALILVLLHTELAFYTTIIFCLFLMLFYYFLFC